LVLVIGAFELHASVMRGLIDVHDIASVVTRPIGDEFDKPLMRPMERTGQELVKQPADRRHHFEIAVLRIAANIVALPRPRCGQDRVQGTGVVHDVEPIADIVAFAVDRDRLAVQRFEDGERDQLSGKW
jgi:hypothetical protein